MARNSFIEQSEQSDLKEYPEAGFLLEKSKMENDHAQSMRKIEMGAAGKILGSNVSFESFIAFIIGFISLFFAIYDTAHISEFLGMTASCLAYIFGRNGSK